MPLSLADLDSSARAAVVNNATYANYASARNNYLSFCIDYSLPPLYAPYSSDDARVVLSRFLAHESARGLGASALNGGLSGVRNLWVCSPPHFRDFSSGDKRVSSILKAFQDKCSIPPGHKQAIPPSAFRYIFALGPDPVVPFVLVFAFVFFLRVSEYATTSTTGCRLQVQHVVATPNSLRLHITHSKGSNEATHHERPFSPGSPRCLLKLFSAYTATRRHNSPTDPAFQWLDGSPVTDSQVNDLVHALAAAAGLDSSSLSSHSLRGGGAVAAFTLGKSDLYILREGRWAAIKSLLLYVRTLAEPYTVATMNTLFPGIFTSPA